jgi:hypothetical protein
MVDPGQRLADALVEAGAFFHLLAQNGSQARHLFPERLAISFRRSCPDIAAGC